MIKFLFNKNYPLWIILVLLIIIGYLAFSPLKKIITILNNRNMGIKNNELVIYVPFKAVPDLEKNKEFHYDINQRNCFIHSQN